MKPIARAWGTWVGFLDRRERGDALAWFRILTGLAVLQMMGGIVVSDVVELLFFDVRFGGQLPFEVDSWLVSLLGGHSPAAVWTLVVISLLGGAAVTVGCGGRLAPLLTSQALLALRGINGLQGAYAGIVTNALWLLVLGRSTATLSLDCRLRTGRWTSDALVMAWPRVLAMVQIAIIYFCTGLYKVSAHWIPGGDLSAVYYILQQPTWHRFDMLWVARIYPLTQLATATTWLFEVSWPIVLVAVYMRHTADRLGRLRRVMNRVDLRKVYLCIGIALHGLIAVSLEVGPFFVATLAFYPCLFAADELRCAARRIARMGSISR